MLIIMLVIQVTGYAQCPPNIDLSEGTFNHWICSTGHVSADGTVTVSVSGPVNDRHTLIHSSTALDPLGQFPVMCPNGNDYSVKLGNTDVGAEAEQVSYVYTIPVDRPAFMFRYYYAVVIQNFPDHAPYEQPRLTISLKDLTTNEDIPCGTHAFTAGDGLADFEQVPNAYVYFRRWTPASLVLTGRQGHTIRFDFTTNDCAKGSHYGYAYLAFDNLCGEEPEPVTGNDFCDGLNKVTLTAMPGFATYQWHQLNSATILGTGPTLTISPVPADGSQYVVDVTPQAGLGCPASFTTTVHKLSENYVFNLVPHVDICQETTIDITDPQYTTGSLPGLHYDYYTDAAGTTTIADPKNITQSGTYYIKAASPHGCVDIKPIQVVFHNVSGITITQPAQVCSPGTVDLTDPKITGGKDPSLTYEYYKDAALTQSVANPQAVSVAGIYYLKIYSPALGCTYKYQLSASIVDLPVVTPGTITTCAPVNIDAPQFHTQNTAGLTYAYYTDAAATNPVTDPSNITTSGIFYAIGTNNSGCSNATPAKIILNVLPAATLDVINPAPVKFPQTIDLSTTFQHLSGYSYTYWVDANATIPLDNYNLVDEANTYYIKATNPSGCDNIKPVQATVYSTHDTDVVFSNTFTPNGDGVNDQFSISVRTVIQVNLIKIYDRYGREVFQAKNLDTKWNGTFNGKPTIAGTYYWVLNGYDNSQKRPVTKSGPVTIIR